MNKRTQAYVVLYKPVGSKCWTPADEFLELNWAANERTARARAKELTEKRIPRMMMGTGEIDRLEFRAAKVELLPERKRA